MDQLPRSVEGVPEILAVEHACEQYAGRANRHAGMRMPAWYIAVRMKLKTISVGGGSERTNRNVASRASFVRYCVTPIQEHTVAVPKEKPEPRIASATEVRSKSIGTNLRLAGIAISAAFNRSFFNSCVTG